MAAVAVVGSPSTTTELVLNVLDSAYTMPLYGQMLTFTLPLVDPETGQLRPEKALGTVTSIQTLNPMHSPGSVESAIIAAEGPQVQHSGDAGDVRSLRIGVEAVFRHVDGAWVPAGTTLSNSPATGTPVTIVDQQDVDELLGADGADRRFLGTLCGSKVVVPYTARSFAGSRGAYHSVVAGTTGSGKSGTVSYLFACELRHESMGQIVVDPQGQFASGHGLPLSVTGLARAAGRDVTVARVSRSLRLRKDAPMMLELVTRTGLFTELAFGAGADAQTAAACRVLEDCLDDKQAMHAATGTDDWTQANPDHLLAYLLEGLRDALPTGTVYAGTDGQNRVRLAIRRPSVEELIESGEAASDSEANLIRKRHRPGVLDQRTDGGKRWMKVATMFATVHNLWSPYSPEGAAMVWQDGADPETLPERLLRRKAWPLLQQVMAHDPARPAPWLFLDISPDSTLTTTHVGDEENMQVADIARRILDDDGVKARIIRQFLDDLLLVGQSQFKTGSPLNVQVTIDEAWRYAAEPDSNTDKAIAALSNRLADACRDARKLGVGMRFVLQAVTGLRDDIWRQCTVRAIGYGMTEAADLKRIENVIGPDHLRVYTGLAGPEASGAYTFMLSGAGLTGLSLGVRPVFLDICTDPDRWLAENAAWLTPMRRMWAHLLPAGDRGQQLLTMPSAPRDMAASVAHHDAMIRRSAQTGQAAAAQLTTNAASTTRPAFGWSPKPVQGALDDDPAPF